MSDLGKFHYVEAFKKDLKQKHQVTLPQHQPQPYQVLTSNAQTGGPTVQFGPIQPEQSISTQVGSGPRTSSIYQTLPVLHSPQAANQEVVDMAVPQGSVVIKQWVYRGPEGSSSKTDPNMPSSECIVKEEVPNPKYDMDPLADEPEVVVKEEFAESSDDDLKCYEQVDSNRSLLGT